MSVQQDRLIFGTALRMTKIFGWILIGLAILSIPQLRLITGRLADSFGLLSSLLLGAAGIAWLVGVKLFLIFFDRYLSRN